MSERLRFGIMCRGLQFPAWEADCIRKLLTVAEPALLIIDGGSSNRPAPPATGRWSRLRRLARPEMPWTLYQRYCVNRRSDVMVREDLSAVLGEVPVLTCRTVDRGRFSRYFSAEDVEAIRERNLDFILRFAFDIVRGRILEVPRYGVWSFHHDDIERYRGGPPCFWEIERDDPVTGAVLQRINDRLDGGVVLRHGWFRTFRTSYRSNRDTVYRGCTDWPAQVCRDLQRGRTTEVDAPPTTSIAPIDYRPGRWQLLRFLVKCSVRYLHMQWRSVARADQWNCGVINRPLTDLVRADRLPAVRWFPSRPRREFLADPIPLAGSDSTVFVEGFDYRNGEGYLTACDLQTGTIRPDVAVPQVKGHLSYPFSFEADGERYCLPEAVATGRLDLWRQAEDGSWQRHGTLLEEPILEPTVVRHGGRWWLFGTRPGPMADTQLCVWFAESLDGPWQPHPQNPVKCDVRSARPAGPLFAAGEDLFRPAQNCSTTYGGSVVLNRIVELSEDRFAEERVTEFRPDPEGPYPHGLHTLAAAGNVTVIDGKREVFIPSAAWRVLRRRWRRLIRRLTRQSAHPRDRTSAGADGRGLRDIA